MITESTKLVTTFLNSDHKKHNWSYQDVDTSLSAQEIKEACELLTTLDIFEQDGVKLFDSVVSAKFVSTKTTTLFDLKNEIDVEEPEAEQSAEVPCEAVDHFAVTSKQAELKKPKLQLPVAIVPLEKTRSAIEHIAPVNQPVAVPVQSPALPIVAPSAAKEPKENNGLLQRIFKRRQRNKADPENHKSST